MTNLPALVSSSDGRYIVVNSKLEMTPDLEHIQRVSFPELAQGDIMSAHHFASHIRIFPDGQHVVLDTLENKVVASSSDIMLELDFNHYQHKFFQSA